MNKKTKGLLAGAAGAALLIGGGTFALWSDSEAVAAGAITAGNLDVELLEGPQWKDISTDREDSPHKIDDLADYRIIPGDTIQGSFSFDAALEGENMVAALSLAGGSAQGDDLLDALDVTVTVDGDETPWDGTPLELEFAAEDNNNGDNPHGLPTLPAELDGTADLEVTVTVYFDAATPDQELVQASTTLGDLAVGLDQVREGAPGYDG